MIGREDLDIVLERLQSVATDTHGFIEGYSLNDFLADKRTQQAVTMGLVILGEVATKLLTKDKSISLRYPGVPWMNIIGMRNRIAHGYFELDFEAIWSTVTRDLPPLIQQIGKIRADLGLST